MDIQSFRDLFNSTGVPYEEMPDQLNGRKVIFMSVTQNHFVFDLDGNFLGCKPDESGAFQPRKTNG